MSIEGIPIDENRRSPFFELAGIGNPRRLVSFTRVNFEGESRVASLKLDPRGSIAWKNKQGEERVHAIDRVHEDDDHALSTGGLENLLQFNVQNFLLRFQILFNACEFVPLILRLILEYTYRIFATSIARISSSDEMLGFLVAKGS